MIKPCGLCRTRTTETRHCDECRSLMVQAQPAANVYNELARLRKAQVITEVLLDIDATADEVATYTESVWKIISRITDVSAPSAATKVLVAALLPAGVAS